AFAVLFMLFLPVSLALGVGGFMTPRFQMVYSAAVEIIFVTVIYWVIAHRIAAPGKPSWRIVDLDDVAAARLPVLVALAAFTSAATRSLGRIADGLYLPVSYTIGQSALSAIVMLVLLALMLLTVANQQGLPGKTTGRRVYFKWASGFVPLLWLGITVGALALLAGYVALASFLAQQLFETAMLVAALFLAHHLSDAAVSASTDPQSGVGRFLRHATRLSERGIERMGLLFRTIIDVVLLLAGLPLLFLLWAVTWVDFRGIALTAVFGFRIGDMTLSPWSVIVVILILLVGIALTNLAVRWLDRRILAQTRVNKGVQDSLRKGASYAGYIIAALIAFTAAGLDFSSLALIAGALGVGIGFGLQSIVNNFVSGLILLAERPVRVGDWVVLASGEGIVKRINVRTTEIETFDSCTIIVPNSSLIAEPVKNWTHGDTIGRFAVSVTVAFDSKPEEVRDLLMELTRSHPKVLTWPEPQVLLARIGPNGLDFEIKANVAHIYDGGIVASDLRLAILKTFAENAITIPRPPALVQPA
ncbi:MAG: mechanosensitive ion channel family protein, partial [Rhizobiales bacterium]|nr:mechanosensitive ion channel family protein [Hyphomicrobiales bacterium]